MNKYFHYILILLIAAQYSCANTSYQEPAKSVAIIPEPASIKENGQTFVLTPKTVIQINADQITLLDG